MPTSIFRLSTGYVDRLDRSTSRVSPKDKTALAKSRTLKLSSKQRLASKVYNLELDVGELQQEVSALRICRSLLHTRALYTHQDADGSGFKNALAYFSAFNQGYRAANRQQTAYLQAVADDALSLGTTGLGRDMLLEQWRRYTAYFAIRFYKFHAVRVLTTDAATKSCVVRAEGVFHGAFTRDALLTAFPTVLTDEQLTSELLGRAMVTPVAFVLHFDQHGKMVRHDGEVDWFQALSWTLDDPIRAAAIMQRAVLAEEGMVYAAQADERSRIEPVEQAAKIKRSRFSRVPDLDRDPPLDDDPSRIVETDGEEEEEEEDRHSVAFMLS